MNYRDFKRQVEEKFIDYLPDEMKNMKVEFLQVNKINRTLDGINIIYENDKGRLNPIIYINDMYEIYQKCGNFEKTMSLTILNLSQVAQAGLDISLDMTTAIDNIIFQVINTEQNRRILDKIPSRPFLDLSITYKWIVRIDEDGIKSVMVNNDLASLLGVTEDELFRLAEENTRRIFPPVVKKMCDCMRDLLRDFPTPVADVMMADTSMINMYVITNTGYFKGASSILYENELHVLAEKLKSDLYILPSSSEEVIAITTEVDPYEMADMVATINMTNLSLEERLSNQVYHYDRKLRKLSLATDTPNKSLEKEGEYI